MVLMLMLPLVHLISARRDLFRCFGNVLVIRMLGPAALQQIVQQQLVSRDSAEWEEIPLQFQLVEAGMFGASSQELPWLLVMCLCQLCLERPERVVVTDVETLRFHVRDMPCKHLSNPILYRHLDHRLC